MDDSFLEAFFNEQIIVASASKAC